MLTYDDGFTAINDLSLEGTITAAYTPEFFLTEFNINGPESTVILAAILDTVPPFDGRTIPAGNEQILVTLVYDVPFGIPVGEFSWITLTNGVGDDTVDAAQAELYRKGKTDRPGTGNQNLRPVASLH